MSAGATVTAQQVEDAIASEHYFTAAEGAVAANPGLVPSDSLRVLTFCVLVLDNGYTVHGYSACASPANFDPALGRVLAREKAVVKIWPLLGYALREKIAAEGA